MVGDCLNHVGFREKETASMTIMSTFILNASEFPGKKIALVVWAVSFSGGEDGNRACLHRLQAVFFRSIQKLTSPPLSPSFFTKLCSNAALHLIEQSGQCVASPRFPELSAGRSRYRATADLINRSHKPITASYALRWQRPLLERQEERRSESQEYQHGLGLDFVEAAHFALRYHEAAKRFYERKRARNNGAVATKALAPKLARPCYHMLKEQTIFDEKRCFA